MSGSYLEDSSLKNSTNSDSFSIPSLSPLTETPPTRRPRDSSHMSLDDINIPLGNEDITPTRISTRIPALDTKIYDMGDDLQNAAITANIYVSTYKDKGRNKFNVYTIMASFIKEMVLAKNTKRSTQAIREQQDKFRHEILNDLRICPVEVNLKSINMSKINYRQLSRELARPDNVNAVMATSCILESLRLDNDKLLSIESNTEVFSSYVRDLKSINVVSVEGYTYFASLEDPKGTGGVKDAFVLKYPRDKNDKSLLHEMLVGILGTDPLKVLIPNYAYIYGGFTCSSPIYDKKDSKLITRWCDSGSPNKISYVVYENIKNSIPMDKLSAECSVTLEDFLNRYSIGPRMRGCDHGLQVFKEVIGQCFYALRNMYKQIDFTHYDLHPGNLLISKLEERRSIGYNSYDERPVYINSQYVAKIIDFGFSHFKYLGHDLGKTRLEQFSIYADKSFIMYDIYKIIVFCALRASNLEYDRVDFLTVTDFIKKLDFHWDLLIFLEEISLGEYPIIDDTQDLEQDDNPEEILIEMFQRIPISIKKLAKVFAYLQELTEVNIVFALNTIKDNPGKLQIIHDLLYPSSGDHVNVNAINAKNKKDFIDFSRERDNIIFSRNIYSALRGRGFYESELKFKNEPVYRFCDELYKFFNFEGGLYNVMYATYIYHLPRTNFTSMLNIDEFIYHFEQVCGLDLTQRHPIINGTFIDVNEINELIGGK